MRDFAWGATRSFKPLHKICDFELMFNAHIRDGHLHKTEPFLDGRFGLANHRRIDRFDQH